MKRRLIRLALRRKSGYISPYPLSMIYPSYRSAYRYRERNNGYVAPVMISLFGTRFVQISAAVVRLPSWLARVLQRTDENGQRPLGP